MNKFIKKVRVVFFRRHIYLNTIKEMNSRSKSRKISHYMYNAYLDEIVFNDEALYVEFFLKHSDIIIDVKFY